MIRKETNLSELTPTPFDSYDNYEFKQFQRTYNGNFVANFVNALSGVVDTKNKNSSDIHLTNYMKVDDIIDIPSITPNPTLFRTSLSLGGKYMRAYPIDETPYFLADKLRTSRSYKAVDMSDVYVANDCLFDVELVDSDVLTIKYTDSKGEQFHLCSVDPVNTPSGLAFVRFEDLVRDFEEFRPQHFQYIYEPLSNGFSLTKPEGHIIEVLGNVVQITYAPNASPITLRNNTLISSRNISNNTSNYNMNSSFTKYSGGTLFSDTNNSEFDLENNFIVHRSFEDERAAIILNKNRIDDIGYSYTTNTSQSFSFNLNDGIIPNKREYCAVFQDIDNTRDDALDLGYVLYDRAFEVKRGMNYFTTPKSLYPFDKISINDTSFAYTGAFFSSTPQYADKIRTDMVPTMDGYQYACTWLSGNFDGDVEWIDRYYYPNYIEKEDAISSDPIFESTYDNFVEGLIRGNSSYKEEVIKTKIFDKKSDLELLPNTNFSFERFNFDDSDEYPVCEDLLDFYKEINNTGEITVDFIFNGDDTPWVFDTDRNKIDAGVSFIKDVDSKEIIFEFRVFRGFADEVTEFVQVSAPYNRFADNLIAFSFNGKTGDGHVLLNNEIIYTISISQYRYGQDRIVLGDFMYNNVFFVGGNDQIRRLFIDNESTPKSKLVILPFLRGLLDINDISIYLPCGQINRVDKVSMLHTLCENKSSKSNMVDINIGNLGINDSSLLESLSGVVINTFNEQAPIGSTIQNINFTNNS